MFQIDEAEIVAHEADDPNAVVDVLDAEALDRAAAGYLAELHGLAPDRARMADELPGNCSTSASSG